MVLTCLPSESANIGELCSGGTERPMLHIAEMSAFSRRGSRKARGYGQNDKISRAQQSGEKNEPP